MGLNVALTLSPTTDTDFPRANQPNHQLSFFQSRIVEMMAVAIHVSNLLSL